ncbi:MAG: hypothetical protein M3322_07960 [Actinomycetota bacterium]|nr:hypothetical protein [Actinomycetota bacterium]
MAVKEIGLAGVSGGWRKKVADRLGPSLAERTRFRADTVRATLGIVFFALAASYVVRTLWRSRKGQT